MRPSGAGSGKRWIGDHVSVEYMYLYCIYFANIWGIYDSWRVSVRPPGAGLGNMFQLNKHISVGYILPTFGGYMAVEGFN